MQNVTQNQDNKKPLTTDEHELRALAIGERLMKMHDHMNIKHVDVIDGVVLVDRVGVGLFPCSQNSTAL